MDFNDFSTKTISNGGTTGCLTATLCPPWPKSVISVPSDRLHMNLCTPLGNLTGSTNLRLVRRAESFLGGYPFPAPDSGRSRKGLNGNSFNNNYQYWPGDSFLNDPSQAQKTGTPLGTRPLAELTIYSCSPCDFPVVCTDWRQEERWGRSSLLGVAGGGNSRWAGGL